MPESPCLNVQTHNLNRGKRGACPIVSEEKKSDNDDGGDYEEK